MLVRFTADSGEVWTVRDTTFSKFKHHRRAHCDPAAKERVFVNAAGVKRSYTFTSLESPVPDAQQLERLLHEASVVGDYARLEQANAALVTMLSILSVLLPVVRLNGNLSVAKEYHESAAVFIGTTLSARTLAGHGDTLDVTVYRVRVDERLRGSPSHVVTILSENSSGRFPQTVGVRYLLFVYRDNGNFVVDNCGNSGQLTARRRVLDSVRRLARQSHK